MLTHCGTSPIHTPRLLLRQYRQSDAEKLFENVYGDPRITDRLGFTVHKDKAVTASLIAMWQEAYESVTVYRWCICLEDEPVGDISVTRWNEADEWCELGYCIAEKHHNHGYMTEALTAVTAYLFENAGFHRVALKHDSANPASGSVMQKCGFKPEGTLRGYAKRRDGSFADICCYSLLKEEYLQKKTQRSQVPSGCV